MFCPYCGAKNAAEPGGQCFVCEKRLPNFGDDSGARNRLATAVKTSISKASPSGEPVASAGDRLLAVILDTIFLTLFIAAAFVGLDRWKGLESVFPTRAWLSGSIAGAFLLLTFIYYWVLEGAFGATLGKAVAGVHVRPVHGGTRIGFRASLWRNLLRLVDGLGFYFVGFLVVLFSRQNRRIGDYAAGTVVVQRNMAVAERATVVALWLAGVAAFSWGAYTLCPRCVELPTTAIVQQLGISADTSVERLASK